MIDALNQDAVEEVGHPFGEYEEEAVVSLLIDHPEFFTNIARYLKYQLFSRTEIQYIIANILDHYNDHGVFPTRGLLLDTLKRGLTVDDPSYEDIIKIAARESDPREVPSLKKHIMEWARSKAYGLLYDPDTIAQFQAGKFDELETVFNQARNIQDLGTSTFSFFDEIERLFVVDAYETFTTGFAQLDNYMHDDAPSRGPARKELLVWMAPTGVGKCHTLQSKIIEKRLSRIFELETDNGKIFKLAGFREVQTTRGKIKVCDLTKNDNITEIPNIEDSGDVSL